MSKRNNGLFATRRDRIMGIVVLAIIATVVLVVILMNASAKNTTEEPTPSYQISDTDKIKMQSTIKDFIVTNGTFGVDWDKIRENNIDVSTIRDAWMVADGMKTAIPTEYADIITTRTTTLTKLIKPRSENRSSLLSTDSNLAKLDQNGLHVLSDSMWMSRFSVDANTVTIDWDSAHAAAGDNGVPLAKITIGWTTAYTRATSIPDAYEDVPIEDWRMNTKTIMFEHVQLGLSKPSGSDEWQVVSIGNTDGATEISDYGSVLATAGDISYDVDGKITATGVNKRLEHTEDENNDY